MRTIPLRIETTLWRIFVLVATVLVFWVSSRLVTGAAPIAAPPLSPMPTKCLGPYNGKQLTQSEVDAVLALHAVYLKTIPAPPLVSVTDPYGQVTTQEREPLAATPGEADPFPASVKGKPIAMRNDGRTDLCGARLTGLKLSGKDLRYSRLMGARLEEVDLTNAILDGADLTWIGFDNVTADGARFRWVQMSHAILVNSTFKKASFNSSVLNHAQMPGSDLTDASFDQAKLNSAVFRGTILGNVDFAGADLSHASYEAKLGSPPRAGSFRSVTGLNSLLSHTESAASLRELQQLLESAGMRIEAARVRAAIVEAKGISNYSFKRNLMRIIYGIPYAYGERPERLLLIVALLIPTFAVFYLFALRRPGNGAIWLTRDVPFDEPDRKMRGILLRKGNCSVTSMAILFSVRTAFRIGWKDFNIGDWLTRMQQQGYRMDAQGWVRSVAGFQSLISVYLLALLILSYIGN